MKICTIGIEDIHDLNWKFEPHLLFSLSLLSLSLSLSPSVQTTRTPEAFPQPYPRLVALSPYSLSLSLSLSLILLHSKRKGRGPPLSVLSYLCCPLSSFISLSLSPFVFLSLFWTLFSVCSYSLLLTSHRNVFGIVYWDTVLLLHLYICNSYKSTCLLSLFFVFVFHFQKRFFFKFRYLQLFFSLSLSLSLSLSYTSCRTKRPNKRQRPQSNLVMVACIPSLSMERSSSLTPTIPLLSRSEPVLMVLCGMYPIWTFLYFLSLSLSLSLSLPLSPYCAQWLTLSLSLFLYVQLCHWPSYEQEGGYQEDHSCLWGPRRCQANPPWDEAPSSL